MTVGFLGLLDKLAATLDDIALAIKKTSGIIGDDLAVGAEGFTKASAKREIPMVLSVMKISFINKLIIVPLVLALSYFLPALLTPILLLGGIFLSYEGVEKIIHAIKPSDHGSNEYDGMSYDEIEKSKIKDMGTIDLILSLEIVLIALATVKDASFETQALVISAVAILATLFIYGVCLLIIRTDDLGMYLVNSKRSISLGNFLIKLMPKIIKTLSVVGTAAMLLVGGDIIKHTAGHYVHSVEEFYNKFNFF